MISKRWRGCSWRVKHACAETADSCCGRVTVFFGTIFRTDTLQGPYCEAATLFKKDPLNCHNQRSPAVPGGRVVFVVIRRVRKGAFRCNTASLSSSIPPRPEWCTKSCTWRPLARLGAVATTSNGHRRVRVSIGHA